MRSTRSHTANRRAHHAIKGRALSKCPDCGSSRLPHTACPNCGKYKGQEVLNVLSKVEKKEKKKKIEEKKTVEEKQKV